MVKMGSAGEGIKEEKNWLVGSDLVKGGAVTAILGHPLVWRSVALDKVLADCRHFSGFSRSPPTFFWSILSQKFFATKAKTFPLLAVKVQKSLT